MVVADGSSGDYYWPNEIDLSLIDEEKVFDWLERNISPINLGWRRHSCSISFKKHEDAWKFLEWLEEYEKT